MPDADTIAAEPAALPPAGVTGQSHAADMPPDRPVALTLALAARALGWPERSARRWAKAGTLAQHLPDSRDG